MIVADVLGEHGGLSEATLAHRTYVDFSFTRRVLLEVHLEVEIPTVTDATYTAGVWTLIRVRHHVRSNIGKALATDAAHVGPLTAMHLPDMCGQVVPKLEPLAADVTDVGSLAGVRPHVLVQVTLANERLAAGCAHMWPLPGVHPDVCLDIFVTAGLPTDGTQDF